MLTKEKKCVILKVQGFAQRKEFKMKLAIIVPYMGHWVAYQYSNDEFLCSGDTYKECAEDVLEMGYIIV